MSSHWHNRFIDQACLHATWSSDTSTKVGAVIVGEDNEILSAGYNGFPRGVVESIDRKERPMKYLYTEHAERNAIYNAARAGIRLKGSTLYMNYYPLPCADCARAIIQAGIVRIIGPDIPFPGVGQQWKEHMQESETMLREAGVRLVVHNAEESYLPRRFQGKAESLTYPEAGSF